MQVIDAGFKKDSLTGLILHVDDKLTVNRQLSVGSSEQAVTVAADALHVNLEDATIAGLINGTQTRELVLSTRNYEQLLSLQPGVAFTGATDQIIFVQRTLLGAPTRLPSQLEDNVQAPTTGQSTAQTMSIVDRI